MADAKGRPDYMRPLETELDLSPQAVPLHWAEGGQVVRVRGTRISLDNIVARYRRGWTPQMIAESYPGVGLANVFSVIAYYLNHQKAVHAYLREVDERSGEIGRLLVESGVTPKDNYEAYRAHRPVRRFYDEG